MHVLEIIALFLAGAVMVLSGPLPEARGGNADTDWYDADWEPAG